MQIFLSYGSEDRELADQVHLALSAGGHQVFFDRDDLPSGGDYHSRIRNAVADSDLFVFLVSRNSVSAGSYALTELRFARDKWAHPKNRVLPVLLEQMDFKQIPAYLKAVTVLEPEGNVSAETLDAISAMAEAVSDAVLSAQTGDKSTSNLAPDTKSARTHNVTVPVLVAVIGMVGVLGAAAIANWEKLFGGNNGESTRVEKSAPESTSSDSEVGTRQGEKTESVLDEALPASSIGADSEVASSTGVSPCAGKGGAAAIRAYSLAVAYPEYLASFVKENAELFASDGNSIQCFNSLTSGLKNGPLKEAYDEIAREAYHAAPQAIREYQLDVAADLGSLAFSFDQLARTLPEMAGGNSRPFEETQLYSASRAWQMFYQMDPQLAEMMDEYRRLSVELNEQFLRALVEQLDSPHE